MQRLHFPLPCAGVLAPQLPPAGAARPCAVSINQYEIVSGASASGSGVVQSAIVRCPAGKNWIGGDATTSVAAADGPMVQGARPFDNVRGREATGVEASAYAGNRVITAWANCAKVAG